MKERGEDSSNEIVLSIVTSCYSNLRLKFLAELLESISRQTCSKIETVVVVDGPDTLYYEVVRVVGEKNPKNPLILRLNGGRGVSASRNLGFSRSSGMYVGFVDDDVVLENSWAANVIRHFQALDEVGAIAGAAEPLWERIEDSWLPKELYWIISCTGWYKFEFAEVRNMWTMNSAVQRTEFELAKGFDVSLGPRMGRESGYASIAEDLEFSLRLRSLGSKILFAPDINCKHHVQHSQTTFEYILKRSLWIGRSRRLLFARGVENYTERVTLVSMSKALLGRRRGTSLYGRPNNLRATLAVLVAFLGLAVGYLAG